MSTPASPPTVLVVDDDDDIRELTRMALELTAGWQVLMAASGPDALEVAREQQPDAVLLDMMMPGMDGLTTLTRLRAEDATADVPVVMFTAKVGIGDQVPWEGYDVRGAIPKPFDPMTLAAQVAELLSWPAPAPR